MKWSRAESRLSDPKWIVLISIALVLETIWLLYELNIIQLPFLKNSKSASSAVEAGRILKSQSDIKKRSGDSLIWEPAKSYETLYYRDSILTLSQSSATLYLKDQTELQMSENTLVTLEEPEERSSAEIRLRFSKGDLTARNPFSKTNIESKDWVVNLEKGAEVALRKTDEAYEFEVLSGQASLQTEKGLKNLVDSKIIKLNENQEIETIDKSIHLKWSEPKPERIYTFEENAKVSLNWQGKAQALKVESQGADIQQKTLQPEQSTDELSLSLGTYQVRLQDEKGISNAKTIEVWKAPKIILKKPLPRDRIAIETPLEFIWTANAEVKSYQLQLDTGEVFDVNENAKAIKFNQEKDLTWKIQARDADGFLIPSLYESKVYLRANTLAAPKLKTPRLLVPETNTTSDPPASNEQTDSAEKPSSILLNIFKSSHFANFLYLYKVPVAEAQVLRRQQVIFEWESVSGADQYIIEISSDPEFKNPEVMETLKSTRFIWKKYDAKKKYYWRVASGHSSGQMGLFSEPVEVQVVIDRTPVKKPVEQEKLIPAPEVKVVDNSSNMQSFKEKEKYEPKLPLFKFGYVAAFKSADVAGDQNSRIQLNGPALLGLELQHKKNIDENRRILADLIISSQKWKPDLQNTTVNQSELNILEIEASLRWAQIRSGFQYGLGLHQSFFAERQQQSIHKVDVLLVGPEVAYAFNENFQLQIGYLISDKINETKLSARYTNYFDENKNYYYGLNLSSYLQSGKFGSGSQSQLQFIIGIAGY